MTFGVLKMTPGKPVTKLSSEEQETLDRAFEIQRQVDNLMGELDGCMAFLGWCEMSREIITNEAPA